MRDEGGCDSQQQQIHARPAQPTTTWHCCWNIILVVGAIYTHTSNTQTHVTPLWRVLLVVCACACFVCVRFHSHTHSLQVVVQQASGNLLWEKGDANRSVTVPEDFPVGSMLVSQCSFNIIDEACNTPELEPVTSDVLALLEAQLEEEAAAEEEQARTTQAAAAVANAFATMGKQGALFLEERGGIVGGEHAAGCIGSANTPHTHLVLLGMCQTRAAAAAGLRCVCLCCCRC